MIVNSGNYFQTKWSSLWIHWSLVDSTGVIGTNADIYALTEQNPLRQITWNYSKRANNKKQPNPNLTLNLPVKTLPNLGKVLKSYHKG